MATKRRNKDGSWSYRVRYPNPEDPTRQESITFARKTDSNAFEAAAKADRTRSTFIDPKAGQVPFATFASETYLKTKVDVTEPTLDNINARIRIHLDYFARKPLRGIRPSDVLSWQASKKGTRSSPATINAALLTLRQVLDLAVRDGLIPRNAAAGVNPLPSLGGREIHPATTEQIVRLADAVDPRFRAAILFDALGSGLRAGELWALKVGSIDFLRRTVRVSESIDDRGSTLVTKTPKNGKPRTLRLDPSSVELLARHLGTYPSTRYVFTLADGMPVRHRNFSRRHFRPATKAVELPVGFRFHDLRHSHASILIADGWRPDQVKDRLGHGSIRTTMDTYSHLFEHDDDDQLVALGGKIRAALA